jgi:hypothetical protein
MTLDLGEQGRIGPPLDGNEWGTLTEFFDYQRAIFAWKTANLTPSQLSQRLRPSSLTLGGLMKHLAYVEGDWVEDDWFGGWLQDELPRGPWALVDWADGRSPSRRWVMTHVMEEYARHTKFLRESLDGEVGKWHCVPIEFGALKRSYFGFEHTFASTRNKPDDRSACGRLQRPKSDRDRGFIRC